MFGWLPAALLGMAAWGSEDAHTVPYVPSASSEGHAGLVRIESRSGVSGQVRVVAVDDAGQRVEAGQLTLGAGAAVEFEMAALESGDALPGLEGTGPGEGDWRLELSTDLDIEARAYARSEGFVTALHDAALVSGEVELPFFNPGGDARRSVLRLANARGEPAAVSVRGVDDAGVSGGPATVELGPWEARSYAASELESGSAAGLTGSLGDGEGKWRLTLSADRGSAYATNLLLDGSGVLSSVPGGMSRGGLHRVPLFPSASDGAGRRGVVRVVNRSAASAEVSIEAFDATDRAYEELRLALEAESSAEFDATDLEQGNAEKGLTGSTGPGEGDWWLELRSESDIEVLSYVETASGPLSALRGTAGVETDTGMRYEALLWGESGEVRLLNAGGELAEVRLSGTDDAGSSGGAVELTLAPWSARTLTATALAEGEAGMRGALGAGGGSWRLRLEADREIDVLSLVRGSGGMLSDVSRRGRPAGAPPRTEVIDATARGRPDLWVTASASEAELSPGEAFELTATVGNRGGSGAPPTTLRYYRSADASITTGDAEVGTDAVAELAAGGASRESASLNAPATPGTHYYGACADAVAEESITSNNCSTGVAVKVTEPPRRPDLAVAATLSDAALEPGESFALSATVRNRGGAQAQATTLRYYRSADASITAGDAEVGTDAVAELAAGATSAGSLTLNAPTTAGTYYYGACADAVAEETNTSNNCSAAVAVKVTEPPRPPDLVVTAASASEAELSPGEAFDLRATVGNRGGDASATTLRYYRSADASITAGDAEVGTDAVAALAAGATSAESLTLNAPTAPGTYYYGACADAVAEETKTANNCSAAVAVKVTEPPRQPDLVVTAASASEAELSPGEAFDLRATVGNRGGTGASATTLRYYRSADASITAGDAEVGTDAVAALAAGATSAESLTLNAPTAPGTYYYGACADAVAGETKTSNNCSAAVAVKVTEPPPRPDLVVTAASASEAELSPGEAFDLRATVGNRGGDASATTLRYYRSADASITAGDAEVGTDAVAALAAGATSAESLTVNAPTAPGTYYYGACADAVAEETNTSNNCSAAVAVKVTEPPPRPDLVVTAASAGEAELSPGEAFELTATVGNRGGDASATTLRYYRSADASITAGDAEVGTDAVAALAAGATSAESLTVNAPTAAGTYYYGACADAVAEETNTSNNCSAAVAVKVTEPPPRPDLVVTAASASEAELSPREAFELTATVGNRGGDASATTLRYYRSADAAITTSDTQVGTDAVAALAAGATSAESLTLNAPTTAGTHYYGACADAVAEETNTSNNCSAAVAVKVTEPPLRPDLVVTAASASEAELSPGEAFELTATVGNRGGTGASATTLRYYRSADAAITTSDTQVGTDAVAALAAGATSAESLTLNARTAPGTHYYGACADAVAEETNTSNNCSAAVAVKVTEPPRPPDLVVTAASASEAELSPGEAFDLRATVGNRGGTGASATTLRYYRSADAAITTSDTQVGTDAVAALAAGATSAESLTLNAPTAPGTYYYGACADAVAGETKTSNNCSAAVAVKVTEPPPRPDLVVTAASASEAELSPGEAFDLRATVRNRGGAQAQATTLRYYRSTDATITTSDTQVGTDAVAALAAGATSAESLTVNAPTAPGTYYYGACADAVPDESDTTNNCSAGLPVTVSEPVLDPPDLVVSVSVDNDTPDAGGEFELTATVRNVGDGASASTTLRYYRSRDAIISPSDIVVGVGPVDALDASGMSTGSIARKAPTTAGTDYYGACVEAVRNESDTTNNCSAAVAITPQRLGPPDLVVVVSAGSDLSELAPGRSLDLDATVTNVGDGPSARTTLRYYWSTDGMIAPSDTELATDAVLALPATGRSNQSAAVTAPSEPGAYYFGACVDAVPDESDTTNNCSPALAATVRPPGPPDLWVSKPSSWCGTHVQGDKAFLQAAVLNYGESTSAPSTMRFYLHRGEATDKWQVTTRTVKSAPPTIQEYFLQVFDVSVDVPNTLGRYGLVACVDVVEGETETTHNCADNSAFEVVQYDPLDDLDLTIPEGCPLEAELCLSVVQRGHWNVHTRHEEGLVRFNLNGSTTLSTDKDYDRVCATVPVNAGSNSMQVDVVPGSGDQKLCPPSGSLTVRGNGAASSGWYVPLGSSTTSTLNVSLGDAGTCPAKD